MLDLSVVEFPTCKKNTGSKGQLELSKLWEYAGYGDILKTPWNITKQMMKLHVDYKTLVKVPT